MNAIYIIYVPVAAAFVVFVIAGGVLLPLWEITESLRDRRRPRRPSDHADVLPIHQAREHDDRKVAA